MSPLELVPFWMPQGPWGALSQWHASPFVVDGVRYATAEHWMMAAKARLFGDAPELAVILATDDPSEAKAAGRRVRGFDAARWEPLREGVVIEGNLHKFGQNDAAREVLLSTGELLLVEASPHDRIWGVGLAADDPRLGDLRRWRGQNLLGRCLMRVRERLRVT